MLVINNYYHYHYVDATHVEKLAAVIETTCYCMHGSTIYVGLTQAGSPHINGTAMHVIYIHVHIYIYVCGSPR